jgi:Ni2+-binding GTPase involved in maturation of urease and hydrogenase
MQLIAALLDLCSEKEHPIIAIDGPAGAGKTTLAHEIYLALASKMTVGVIHLDDLYDGWENALGADLTKVLLYLSDQHKQQKPARINKYNWTTSSFEDSKEAPPSKLLILEGVGSGDMAIQDDLAALIWIDIDPEIGVKRVIARDGAQVADEMRKWLGTQEEYFSQHSTREKADFILTT